MHASVIRNEGKGYLFLAPSGIGKSTHSRQWLKCIPGSDLLNDDNPIVRIWPDGRIVVYGSPWSGKKFTPLQMAELLEQKYEVDHETALRDSETMAQKWIEAGIAEQ